MALSHTISGESRSYTDYAADEIRTLAVWLEVGFSDWLDAPQLLGRRLFHEKQAAHLRWQKLRLVLLRTSFSSLEFKKRYQEPLAHLPNRTHSPSE